MGLGQVEPQPQHSQAGLEQGEWRCLSSSLPQRQPSAGAVGYPWEEREGPQGPRQCQGSGTAISQAWDAGWSLPEHSPVGWAAFGCRERAVWVRTMENGVWAAA